MRPSGTRAPLSQLGSTHPLGVRGGFLLVGSRPVSWFATKFTAADESAVGLASGTSAFQQVGEALAILFGMRAWVDRWAGATPRLHVRSDSVTALSLLARMQTSSPHTAVVARELALTLCQSCIRPRILEHTPGVANKVADVLSRRYEPGVPFVLPKVLQNIPECVLPSRDTGYYRALATP